MSSSDFSYLMGSSLLDSIVFDKPNCIARGDIDTADPILDCLSLAVIIILLMIFVIMFYPLLVLIVL